MTAQMFVLLLLAVVVTVYVGMALVAWFRMRGKRVVTCPETHKAETVEVDAVEAALSAVWEDSRLQLKTCSRWPERAGCDQGCVAQIQIAPHDTLATAILAQYFSGKTCGVCHRGIEPVHAGTPHPGVLDTTTGSLVAWEDMKATEIGDRGTEIVPVCANCIVTESFRRQHPDLVTDRPERPFTTVH